MPSTLVHLAVAALVGTALLARAFDRRSLGVVLAAAAVPDLDTFVGLAVAGAHRAALHTLLLPAGLAALWYYDTRHRERSVLRARYGDRGVRVAWVAVVAMLVGGIAPDLFTNGVNALYPVYDRFVSVNGELLLSNQRGVVQTFVELAPPEAGSISTTQNTHYWTGVDPTPGADPANVERVFPVVRSGTQLLLVLVGFGTAAARLWEQGRRD